MEILLIGIISNVGGVKKLIPNLGDKIEYVTHYENLKYYSSLGIKLVKVHRNLKFKQSNWLKSYADFNTKERQESPNEFSKQLYKLLNNCICGKSIASVRERVNIKLINDKKVYQQIVNNPNFMSQKIFSKKFVTVHCSNSVLTLNKPIYVVFVF